MDTVFHELRIPKKYYRETKRADRFVVVTHKLWLKYLVKHRKLIEFPIHSDLDEWLTNVGGDFTNLNDSQSIGPAWTTVHFEIYKKSNYKVFPLPQCQPLINDEKTIEQNIPLSFSQLLQYISQTNHQNLWRAAYEKYGEQAKATHRPAANKSQLFQQQNQNKSINLIAHDDALREIIQRTYGCQTVNLQLDRLRLSGRLDDFQPDEEDEYFLSSTTIVPEPRKLHYNFEPHVNLYPIISAIETSTHFVLVFSQIIENNLLDLVTYSPAIVAKSHNKPLFLVYQLLQLTKSLHDRGLLLGNVELGDIYLTENLWLNVMPRLDANIMIMPQEEAKKRENSKSVSAEAETTNKSGSLKDYCEMWCQGQLSNYDYLTILNNLSGRRLGHPGYHHIMPWVTDFVARNGMNWRDLKKSKYRLNKGDAQLDLMFMQSNENAAVPHHVSDILSEITYFIYMARRTSKVLLCKHVRPIWVPTEYPASIQRLQEWTPDECIPEFFSDPMVFKSIHEDLPDLELPVWASCPEDFIAKHREALESQYVSERLHHWIDLNFGYKLTGSAAIKAKNVCLSLVNDHRNLCERGIVQLFQYPHPTRQSQTPWTGKFPPRIYSQTESKRRLTRSSEDLSHTIKDTTAGEQEHLQPQPEYLVSSSPSHLFYTNSHKLRNNSPSIPEDNAITTNIERSTSYHTNVQIISTQNQINLPKDYNPVAALTAVETMEIFLSKTFYHNLKNGSTPSSINYELFSGTRKSDSDDEDGGYTNRMFSRTFREEETTTFSSDSVQNTTSNYRHIIDENRSRELQVIGCIIVEIFLAKQLRPLGSNDAAEHSFVKRRSACLDVLKYSFELLPKCVQYPVKLLLQLTDDIITDKGLPQPSANQILQPLLNNFLFPFPFNYRQVYGFCKSLKEFDEVERLLDYWTFFQCDGKQCAKYESLDRIKIAFNRKIAECKVKACVIQIDRLLEPIAYDQFNSIELILPHILDLLQNEETSILVAWYLFDRIAIALGPTQTYEHLLNPILRLYECSENDERLIFINSNFDSSMKFTTSSAFKSRKTIKLYHHSFLLRLIVRFGLKRFLENFISPLIEAVGGYKEPDENTPLHYHEELNGRRFLKSRSSKNLNYQEADHSFANCDDKHESTLISEKEEVEEMFSFENELDDPIQKSISSTLNSSGGMGAMDDSSDYEAENAILKIIDQFDLTSEGSLLDLRLNHSTAEEAVESTTTDSAQPKLEFQHSDSKLSEPSFDDDPLLNKFQSISVDITGPTSPTTPTIPIPLTFHRSNVLNTIDCEIGSRKSIDSNEFVPSQQPPPSSSSTIIASLSTKTPSNKATPTKDQKPNKTNFTESKQLQQNRISEMSAESLIWLSHRLGPVLTARYLSRNLLKMLTLCYVGQENLLPNLTATHQAADDSPSTPPPLMERNLLMFSIADGIVVGDQNSIKVLECLTSISSLFGDQFVLLQYFPHISELILLCKKRITASLEGGLISSLQLLKYLVPCLSDSTIMDQLHDIILNSIIHPIIRLLGSSRCLMPSGFLARSVLARKLLDTIYVLAVRIGPEMTKEHLCVPALQRFFLIFDKAYGIVENLDNATVGGVGGRQMEDLNAKLEASPSNSSDDSNFIEIRREGGAREWCVTKGSPIQISHARNKNTSLDSITPPPKSGQNQTAESAVRERAQEEICDVFTPSLAHVAYLSFLKYLGDHVMTQIVKNLSLILNLCHEFEQPARDGGDKSEFRSVQIPIKDEDTVDYCSRTEYSNSFGTMVIGNRIDVQKDEPKKEIGPMELLDFVTYKYEQINTARHLRGNWLAYWEHEIGRSEKENRFNLKQIKLQTFLGHSSSIRSLLCLDNENSFMSASKDKTVKLWSLRSEGDGTKVSSCQFTYTNHRKSVHSLAFLESLRLTVSCDSGVHLWDPFYGAQVGQLDSHKLTPVSVVKTYPAPSPLVLAGTAESTIKIIDARTFSYVNEWRVSSNSSGSVRCIAISPSGTWISVGLSSGQLVLFDGRTGTIVASWKATDGELLQLIAPNDQQIISSSLDHSICVWSSVDGALLFQMKNPAEPAHCIVSYNRELLFGTPANRIGIYPSITPNIPFSITKLRSETFKGVLTSLAILPLNRMLLVGGDSGNISLLC